jgi:ABC-type sugar transport system ATPase subunit
MIQSSVKPGQLTKLLTVAEMQMVQIARALSIDTKILILDEPCSSISEEDSERLFAILRDLKLRGIGIIYIDHRLENIFKLGDRVTVLRDGENIGTKYIEETDQDEIIRMMVGRTIANVFLKDNMAQKETALSIKNFTNRKINGIDIEVRRGEIFGLGGLVGSGRSEIVRAIFGIDRVDKNAQIKVLGKKVKISRPIDAIKAGIGYIPEDRKIEGLCLFRSIMFNTVLVYLKNLVRRFLVDDKLALEKTMRMVDQLNVKLNKMSDDVSQLSGGNQQKIVLAKWLMIDNLKVLLMDEPTRGIDVGTKHQFYKIINELAKQGIAIIIITSELPELLGLCDRIAVINNGRINGLLERGEFSQEKVMRLCI